jgi:hypothetical protein
MDNLKTLCEVPFKDKTLTALDVSGKNLGTEGALVVAEYLDGNRVLSCLNLANNMIGLLSCPEGWETMEDSGAQYFMSSTQRWTTDPPPGAKPEGVIALADAIPDMGALSKLDVSTNGIPPEEKALLQGACDAKGASLAL